MPNRIVRKPYGTVGADRQREMSGLEFVQGLVDATLPLNMMAKTLGYDVAEAVNGRVVVTAEPRDIHLNPAGTVHGGLAATLLDSCMGLAIQSTLDKGVGQTTLEFKISLLRPITPDTGMIRAEGTVLSRGRRVGTAEGRLTDGAGRLLAHGVPDLCKLMADAGRLRPVSPRQNFFPGHVDLRRSRSSLIHKVHQRVLGEPDRPHGRRGG